MRRHNTGAALITALLVVAIATAAAVLMAQRQLLWTQQVAYLQSRAQADAVAQAALDWARGLLAQDARGNHADHLGQAWARGLAGLPVEGSMIEGAITDQQGLFNLNNLVRDGQPSVADAALFKRLLQRLRLPESLLQTLRDRLAEDTGRAPLAHVDELYRLRGYDAEVMARLRPVVTALPSRTTINVNTAPREILRALLPDYDETDISQLLAARAGRPFERIQDFIDRLPKPAPALRDDLYGVTSRYFTVDLRARAEQTSAGLRALLVRPPGRGWPKVVWQQRISD